MESVLGGFPVAKNGFFCLLQKPAAPEMHCHIQRTFCFCVEKSLGRWDGGGEIYYCLWCRCFFHRTALWLAKEPANRILPRPLPHPRITIGQSALKVDKPPSPWRFIFLFFLSLCEVGRKKLICNNMIIIYHEHYCLSKQTLVATHIHPDLWRGLQPAEPPSPLIWWHVLWPGLHPLLWAPAAQ